MNPDDLRRSNKELLQKLKIGQSHAWDILHGTSQQPTFQPIKTTTVNKDFKAPYTFSTPTKVYLDILDKAGKERLSKTTPTRQCSSPLTDILNVSSSSSNIGRPHKTPLKHYLTESPPRSPSESPRYYEHHRERLHQKINSSYSKLATDLRQLVPCYGADLAFDLTSSSNSVANKPDSYYDDMKRFRMANSDLCSVKLPDNLNTSRNTTIREFDKQSENVPEREHQCIQTYCVTEGYKAVDAHGDGQCPLCIGADDTQHRGLIQVTIPHSQLVDHKIYPKAPDDSVSLASHCSAGWGNSLHKTKKWNK